MQVFDLDSVKDLALSPVVIATYEGMARALVWPNEPLGWEEIIALAQSQEGWAKYPSAKVEWGRKPRLDNRFRIAEIIDRARANGGTALYDVVKRSLELLEMAQVQGNAIRGIVLPTDGMRTAGRVKLSDVVRLTTRSEELIWSFEGDERQRKEHLIARDLAFSTQHPVHIFSIGLGQDVDWEGLRLLAEATNSTFNRVSEKDLAQVLARFGKYF